jgi:TATA-binding protein-associated factor
MRKLNSQTSVSSSPTPASTPASPNPNPDVVVIDPGAKARAAGGQVDVEMDAEGNPTFQETEKVVIPLALGQSPWMAVVDQISPLLDDPVWQVRQGAALAIMEIVRSSEGAGPTDWLLDVARQLISLLVMDRFGDFLGDTVVAPVREAAAQALGVVIKYLDFVGVEQVHSSLMAMIAQPWCKRGPDEGKEKWERFAWEIRHAGLLGMRYEVAVRPDLLGAVVDGDTDVKPDVGTKLDLLNDVVQATSLA